VEKVARYPAKPPHCLPLVNHPQRSREPGSDVLLILPGENKGARVPWVVVGLFVPVTPYEAVEVYAKPEELGHEVAL